MKQLYEGSFRELMSGHYQFMSAHFESRASDVYVSTPPKAGTTWMMQILHQLKTKGDEGFSNIYDVVPWLEWPSVHVDSAQVLAEYQKNSSPRLFKTHLDYDRRLNDSGKTVFILRDPRDCCLSFYHHRNGMSDETLKVLGVSRPVSMEAHVEDWINSRVWLNHVLSWWPHRFDDDVFFVLFDHMKADIDSVVTKLLAFLGWSLREDELTRVKGVIAFSWMSAHQDKFSDLFKLNEPSFAKGQFIRAGKTGEGKKRLSPELNEQIMTAVGAYLPKECLALFVD